jgi:hypothetical protein
MEIQMIESQEFEKFGKVFYHKANKMLNSALEDEDGLLVIFYGFCAWFQQTFLPFFEKKLHKQPSDEKISDDFLNLKKTDKIMIELLTQQLSFKFYQKEK